ncbi:MAG: aminoglycoside phosphotransferase family protein, partial [Burkholderiaceae bacterium]
MVAGGRGIESGGNTGREKPRPGKTRPEGEAIIGVGSLESASFTRAHSMSSALSSSSAAPPPDARRTALAAWLGALRPDYGLRPATLRPASADASFRRYFRVDAGDASLIAMDAPPDKEDSRPFIRGAGLLRDAGLNAPQVLEADLAQGFLLLTDLGATTYLSALNDDSASALFDDAMDALVRWQLASRPGVLPPYDDALLRRELGLFPDWYLARHLCHALTERQSEQLQRMF